MVTIRVYTVIENTFVALVVSIRNGTEQLLRSIPTVVSSQELVVYSAVMVVINSVAEIYRYVQFPSQPYPCLFESYINQFVIVKEHETIIIVNIHCLYWRYPLSLGQCQHSVVHLLNKTRYYCLSNKTPVLTDVKPL